MKFFDDGLLLNSKTAFNLYNEVRNLPIIDYHCHLNDNEIADNKVFHNLGELWLSGDHYKWRAMRICGVDERYITGDASDYDKFLAYAEIMPKLVGNQLYYWTHMELEIVFGIKTPLNEDTAKEIYESTEKQLKNISVRTLLEQFNVEFIATTDDPISELKNHRIYGNTNVTPTFRPDKALDLEENYLKQLGKAAGFVIDSLFALKEAMESRLQFFITKGCRISDHGMDFLPDDAVSDSEAEGIFNDRINLTAEKKAKFFTYMMEFFAALYEKYNITMQLHFGTYRNINTEMFGHVGRDAGFDVFRNNVDTDKLIRFLDRLNSKKCLPKVIIYSLNPSVVPAMCAISGAFRDVRVGAAWWFSDSVEGIKEQLSTIANYSVLGVNLGMLTDSRSFTSYSRFDFFRRIIANYVGDLVEKGEYNKQDAAKLMRDICYNNAKEFIIQ